MADGEHRAFSTLIGALEDGALHKELTDGIRDLIGNLHNAKIDQGGKPKGSVTLVLSFKLDGDVIECEAACAIKQPKRLRNKTVLYATEDNHLTIRNPKQRDLPLRDANAAREPVRAV